RTGTPVASSFFFSFLTGTSRDDIAPALAASLPAVGATGVALNATIRLRFSKAIDPVTLTAQSLTLRDAAGAVVACATTVSSDDRVVTFTPLRPLAPNTAYPF